MNREKPITKEELDLLIKTTVSRSYLEGIQFAIDVLTKLKQDIEAKNSQ